MHGDFIPKFHSEKVSYEYYRKEVNKINISFTRQGEEECEECVLQWT